MEHISSRALLKDIEADFARAGAAAEADGRPRT